jgi:small subunit ribosomal protein S4
MKRGPKVKIARALGIALTPKAARIMERRPDPPGQHGAVTRRKVDRPSYRLEAGDTVALSARSRDMPAFTVPLENARPPAYLQLDRERRQARVAEIPEREQIPVQSELSLIVEYYSR